MRPLQKFIPFNKIDEQSDGTLIVHGLFTAEKPDLDNEVCDYEKSKPYWKALGERQSAATSKVEGMAVSMFPLREMHQLKVAGAGRSMDFNDARKEITGSAHVVDKESCNKVRTGSLIGFSQGGRYVGEPEPDPVYKGCVRYVSDPGEVSLVDSPCLPSALIDSIRDKALTVQFTKANGKTELRKLGEASAKSEDDLSVKIDRIWNVVESLQKDKKTKRVSGEDLTADCFAYVGDSNDPSTWKLPIEFKTDEKSKSHIQNALARFDQTQGIPAEDKDKVKRKLIAAAKDHGIDVAEESKKIQAALEYWKATEVQKGLYQVAQMAPILETLDWIRQCVTWEREIEGDASTAPESFAQLLEDAAQCFLELAQEEVEELLAASSGKKETKAMKTLEEIQKALDATAGDLTKAKDHMKAIHGHVTKAHDHHEKMAAHHDGMHKAHTDAAAHHDDIAKALDKAHDMTKGHEAQPHIKAAMDAHKGLHKFHKSQASAHEKMAAFHKAHAEHLGKAVDAVAAAMEGKEPDKVAPEPTVLKADHEAAISELTKTVTEQAAQIGELTKSITEVIAKAAAPAPAPAAAAAVAAVAEEEDKAIKDLKALVKTQGEQLEALLKTVKEMDPTIKAKLTLVPRPGQEIHKTVQGIPEDGKSLAMNF